MTALDAARCVHAKDRDTSDKGRHRNRAPHGETRRAKTVADNCSVPLSEGPESSTG